MKRDRHLPFRRIASGRETPHRFFVPPEVFSGEMIQFPRPVAHQISRVLRLQAGDRVTVLDNSGHAFHVELCVVAPVQVSGIVLSRQVLSGEPLQSLTLYLSLTQREKFEWILQKCTEVGATAFVPLISSRSLVQNELPESRKLTRWQKILQEAAEQSGRARIPQLKPVCYLTDALETASREHDLCLMAWEGESVCSLRQALTGENHLERVAILIGPEGGFSGEEVDRAVQNGWRTVSLGTRILRMETAAVVATALILYELEQVRRAGVQSAV